MEGKEIHYWRYGLRLRNSGGGANAKSSRRVLEGMLIRADGGFGCLHPWPELGDEPLRAQWDALHGRRAPTRLVERALECCRVDGAARREGRSLFEGLTVPESHATFIAAGSGTGTAAAAGAATEAGAGRGEAIPAHAQAQADFEKLKSEGFTLVKLKGGRDWRLVLNTMRAAKVAGLRVRVDFNGVLSERDFLNFAAAAADDEGLRGIVDFVEDPVPYEPETWRRLAAETGWRLALDWLPVPLSVEAAAVMPGKKGERQDGKDGGFAVRVIKPVVEPMGEWAVPVVVTSAMDHPVGQLFAAYEAARFGGTQLSAGLLTHRLFEADAFTERLGGAGPGLTPPGGTGLGFDDLLAALPWQPLVRQGNRARAGQVLWNPREPLAVELPVLAAGEIGFPTSGSTGMPSVIVHTDESLEASAASVNTWLETGSEDVWLRVLPLFHVGGRQIHTRAELAGSRVVEHEGKWSAREFADICRAEGATLASLVPAQVFDLVAAGLSAPDSLRAVVVGGGALEEPLWRRARELGWPVLPSYGSSEAASQVATARISRLRDKDMPPLELLPGWEARVAEADESGGGLLELNGPALALARLGFDEVEKCWRRTEVSGGNGLPAASSGENERDDGDADSDAGRGAGWWRTADRVRLQGRELRFAGRADRVVKVLGELVNPAAVEHALAAAGLESGTFAVIPLHSERRGNELALVTEKEADDSVLRRYAEMAAPFARISRVVRVEALPRSALGKVRYGELEKLIPPPAARG
ncbi:MAG: AMP-binding protein [Verrucomicrobiota bacterium]